MADSTPQKGSLGDEVTRGGDLSQAEIAGQPKPGGTRSALGDLETGADSRSSLSDLADLGEDGEVPREIVDLTARYELGEVLGRGGMGEVIRAVDRRLKRPVAIKRMRADLGASRSAMRRFLTEAVSVAALNHFNVVQIHDYGHTAEGPFLVMELVDGQTLAEKLADGPLPLEEALELMEQLCDGLQAAHDRGIVHRDIKPANILLTSSGIPRLTDFGLAKDVSDSGQTQAGAVLGTLDYMPPEQKTDSSQADARSDQWSLAATCYQMVTGESPRVIDTEAIPEPVRDVLRRALKTNPEERFESVRDFGRALKDLPAGQGDGSHERSKLVEGQCTGCGTINSVDRQFCRDCGSALKESCPDCGTEAGVWEKFCGSCGADIEVAIAVRVDAAKQQVLRAQLLLKEQRFTEALDSLESLLAVEHPSLKAERGRAAKARKRILLEQAEYESRRTQLLAEARQRQSAGSYTAALQILDRIPEHLRNEETRELSARWSEASAEARQLAGEIGQAVRRRKYDGLEPQLVRYIELKPRDEKAVRLLQKLRDRAKRHAAPAAEQDAEPVEREASGSLLQPGETASDRTDPATEQQPAAAGEEQKSGRRFLLRMAAFCVLLSVVVGLGWIFQGGSDPTPAGNGSPLNVAGTVQPGLPPNGTDAGAAGGPAPPAANVASTSSAAGTGGGTRVAEGDTSWGDPADPTVQQLLKLRDGLNGKMDYDPDSGEITILYSFLHDREFEDFRFTTSRPSSDGILNLPSDGKATHTVKFSEFAVEATLHVQRRPFGAYFQTTSGISGSYDTSGTGGVVLRGPAFRDRWIPSPNQFQRGGAIPCHFQVQGGTARFQLGNTSAAQPVNRTTPAQVQLSGGSKGAGFADLVIRGTVDETWLAFYEIPGEAGDD